MPRAKDPTPAPEPGEAAEVVAKEAKEASPADDIVRLETEYATLLRSVQEAQDQRKQLENKRFLAEMNERINVGDGGVGLVIGVVAAVIPALKVYRIDIFKTLVKR